MKNFLCFIEGCVHAVSFYGAVAKHFVPDNLKTAVTKHTKDDLVLQSTFSDLEDFYDTIVLPHHRLVSLRESQRSRIMCVTLKHIL